MIHKHSRVSGSLVKPYLDALVDAKKIYLPPHNLSQDGDDKYKYPDYFWVCTSCGSVLYSDKTERFIAFSPTCTVCKRTITQPLNRKNGSFYPGGPKTVTYGTCSVRCYLKAATRGDWHPKPTKKPWKITEDSTFSKFLPEHFK